jgi:hypothetical protein
MAPEHVVSDLTVKITPNDRGNPPGKLADAELHFADPVCPVCLGYRQLRVAEHGPLAGAVGICTTCDGHGVLIGANPLAGLKLIGFSIWERRTAGGRNVTFPARQYSVNGERRSFALLRPIVDVSAQDRVRELIQRSTTEPGDSFRFAFAQVPGRDLTIGLYTLCGMPEQHVRVHETASCAAGD